MYLLAAISIGLLGSLHCLGMCGPIIATVHQGKRGLRSSAIYHAGRLMTYATMGAIAGAIGHATDWMGYQQAFSMIVGILLVVSVIVYPLLRWMKGAEALIGKWTIRFTSWIHRSGLNRNETKLLMGVANGILPCGLVYLAIAGAANTFTPWDGAAFMLAFGVGTLPVLSLVGQLTAQIRPGLRTRARKLIPITLLVMGGLLIARGMDLGIPYLSPKANVESNEIEECH